LTLDDIPEDALFDEANQEIGIPDSAADEPDELKKLRQEGAKPVTFAPENSSYLEEDGDDIGDSIGDDIGDKIGDPITDEIHFHDDSLDLSDAVIDEPELSADHIDEPLTEPSLDDIDIDIDIPPEPQPAEEEFEIHQAADEVAMAEQTSDDNFVPGIAHPEEPQANDAITAPSASPAAAPTGALKGGKDGFMIPSELKSELRNILTYMDQLLESLPEEKIEEFAKSEYFDSYKKLFKDLGLV
jgi:hypothetical protein